MFEFATYPCKNKNKKTIPALYSFALKIKEKDGIATLPGPYNK